MELELRDKFALKSLELLIAHRSWKEHELLGNDLMQVWAQGAYALADAMIEEKNRVKDES